MKFAVLSYDGSGNIGNEIQSIAAEKLLPKVDIKIPMEQMSIYQGEPVLLVMNAFFGGWTTLPPSPAITPLYIAVHICPSVQSKYATTEWINHLKQHLPIGCRDKGTMQFLQSLGIDAYFSGCLTLTLPLRENIGLHNYAVDYPRRNKYCKGKMYAKRSCITVSHKHNFDSLGNEITFQMARNLLKRYQSAKHIYTSRLHCALPSGVMGIPVTFLGVHDRRTDCLLELGDRLKLPPLKWRYAIRKPSIIHVELDQEKVQHHKQQLIKDFNNRLNKLLSNR